MAREVPGLRPSHSRYASRVGYKMDKHPSKYWMRKGNLCLIQLLDPRAWKCVCADRTIRSSEVTNQRTVLKKFSSQLLRQQVKNWEALGLFHEGYWWGPPKSMSLCLMEANKKVSACCKRGQGFYYGIWCQRFHDFIYWRLIIAGKDVLPPIATAERSMTNLPWEQQRFF